MTSRAVAFAAAALLVLGCDRRAPSSDPPAPTIAPAPPAHVRAYGVHTPAGWDRAHPAPLVLLLHGYGSSGDAHAQALGLTALADAKRFVLAAPDGLIDASGHRFWNATDACCDFDGKGGDDVAYLGWLLDDVASRMPIDRRRVYVVGHSNGGFMALRLACDLAPRIAAVVSISGAGWKDPSRCTPGAPVSVLQIHGDADDTIRMQGGRVFDKPGRDYPPVSGTVGGWVARDGCDPAPHPGTPFDFDGSVPGDETSPSTYGACKQGVSVSLWTIHGGGHVPAPTPAGLDEVWRWLESSPQAFLKALAFTIARPSVYSAAPSHPAAGPPRGCQEGSQPCTR